MSLARISIPPTGGTVGLSVRGSGALENVTRPPLCLLALRKTGADKFTILCDNQPLDIVRAEVVGNRGIVLAMVLFPPEADASAQPG